MTNFVSYDDLKGRFENQKEWLDKEFLKKANTVKINNSDYQVVSGKVDLGTVGDEFVGNKISAVTNTNKTSTTLYPSINALTDWCERSKSELNFQYGGLNYSTTEGNDKYVIFNMITTYSNSTNKNVGISVKLKDGSAHDYLMVDYSQPERIKKSEYSTSNANIRYSAIFMWQIAPRTYDLFQITVDNNKGGGSIIKLTNGVNDFVEPFLVCDSTRTHYYFGARFKAVTSDKWTAFCQKYLSDYTTEPSRMFGYTDSAIYSCFLSETIEFGQVYRVCPFNGYIYTDLKSEVTGLTKCITLDYNIKDVQSADKTSLVDWSTGIATITGSGGGGDEYVVNKVTGTPTSADKQSTVKYPSMKVLTDLIADVDFPVKGVVDDGGNNLVNATTKIATVQKSLNSRWSSFPFSSSDWGKKRYALLDTIVGSNNTSYASTASTIGERTTELVNGTTSKSSDSIVYCGTYQLTSRANLVSEDVTFSISLMHNWSVANGTPHGIARITYDTNFRNKHLKPIVTYNLEGGVYVFRIYIECTCPNSRTEWLNEIRASYGEQGISTSSTDTDLCSWAVTVIADTLQIGKMYRQHSMNNKSTVPSVQTSMRGTAFGENRLNISEVVDASGNSLVDWSTGVATISGGGSGGGKDVKSYDASGAENTDVCSASTTLVSLKIPYVTEETDGSKWLNVYNVTKDKWEQVSVTTLAIEV